MWLRFLAGAEGLEVGEVLSAAGQALVQDQVLASDEIDSRISHDGFDPPGPSLVKGYSGE